MLPEPRLRDFAGIFLAWGAIFLGVVILVIAMNLIGCGPSPALEAGTTPIEPGDLRTMRCGGGELFCAPPTEACVLRNSGVDPYLPQIECVFIPESCRDDPRCECMEEVVCPGFQAVCYYVGDRPYFYGCLRAEVL